MKASLEQAIERRIGEVRTDAFDISFGELISLYEAKEFEIRPDFQRFFRWENEQKSRLIESILLELPIPQVFVIENANGVLELIDGLQRISSVIQFVESNLLEEPNKTPLRLHGCDLVPELNTTLFTDLPLVLRNRIKRAKVRAVVIKRQSTPFLRYEMFKRLNTGGAALSPQEVRNCTSRMVGEEGARFYGFLMACAANESFSTCIASLSEESKRKKGDEELVLRFLALKNAKDDFEGSVVEWLDSFMESVILGKRAFDYDREAYDFDRLFRYLAFVMGEDAFVRHRGVAPIGGLAPAHFEAISLGAWRVLPLLGEVAPDQVKRQLINTIQTDAFRENVGPGSNSLQKFNGRIDIVEVALRGLIP